MSSTTKIVNVNINSLEKCENKPEKNENKPKKRAITTDETWNLTADDLSQELQISYIHQLSQTEVIDTTPCKLIMQHIAKKISGYKSQDIKKSLYEPDKIVDIPYVLKTLENAENICYYCKNIVQVLYENVREPLQWTLDRINNDIGHNKNNVVIACLQCNIGRKTMHQERYAFTKQLVIKKKDN